MNVLHYHPSSKLVKTFTRVRAFFPLPRGVNFKRKEFFDWGEMSIPVSDFFPLKFDFILEGLNCPGKKKRGHKSCFPF